MQVPFVDLKKQYAQIKDEVLAALKNVCENTAFILGPNVLEFEKNFAEYVGVQHCVALNSGTAGNQIALQALIQPGDEVITAPNTFIATSEGITAAGGKVVFCDIDEQSYNLDPKKLEEAITPKTRAIVPVHLYGQPADMDPIMEIARKHDLFVIEDAAQAHGASYRGKNAGAIGHAAVFSFYPGKNLGAYGEGGAITTNMDKVADFARLYRDHGSMEKYIHEIEGHNFRMEGFQGAVLNVKLNYIEEWTEARRKNAHIYNQYFQGVEGVITPTELPERRHVYHLYVLRVKDRDGLQKYLGENGVASGFHYKYPLHLQKAYAHLNYKEGDFPVTEKVMGEIISLPMFPELTEEQIAYTVEKVKEFLSLN
jgi:dTDP-4-amino-4,6-dideoxygalactose transaminase